MGMPLRTLEYGRRNDKCTNQEQKQVLPIPEKRTDSHKTNQDQRAGACKH
ncbi:MAG: hypothetical protein DHS20C09_22540 [marine bacterium B5-7]|nr:MAG: hypothetical protein DHS20C09_22540 [marine bacterium B5-7]